MDKQAIKVGRREQYKVWAKTMVSSTSASKRREASNGIYKAFFDPLTYWFTRNVGTSSDIRDPEDLTLQTLEKAFSKIKLYDPSCAEFSTWIFKIALNCLIDSKRASNKVDVVSVDAINYHKLNAHGDDSDMFELPSNDRTPLDEVSSAQRAQILRQAVDSMKNKTERMVIRMLYFDELRYEEIAEKTGMPLGSVKVAIFRGKHSLKMKLDPVLRIEASV